MYIYNKDRSARIRFHVYKCDYCGRFRNDSQMDWPVYPYHRDMDACNDCVDKYELPEYSYDEDI